MRRGGEREREMEGREVPLRLVGFFGSFCFFMNVEAGSLPELAPITSLSSIASSTKK